MAMKLSEAVPFGRSLQEYVAMFSLSLPDLEGRILSVADGPASFNAELTSSGGKVISLDPIYQLSSKSILNKFYEVLELIIQQVNQTSADWVWKFHASPEDLRKHRIEVAETFYRDYSGISKCNRYIGANLPHIPFKDKSFDLALCSHFLFLYSQHFTLNFHIQSILDMLRVSQEVRIFPLLSLDLKVSPHLNPVCEFFTQNQFEVQIVKVEYELQRGGNQMLRIRKKK